MKKILFCLIFLKSFNVLVANSDQQLQVMESFDVYGNAVKSIFINYVEEVAIDSLLKNSIEGMLAGLDPYTEYFDSKPSNELNILTNGRYVGYGFGFKSINNKIVLTHIRENTPAEKAGMQIGDILYSVDTTIIYNQFTDLEDDFFMAKETNTLFRIIRNGLSDTLEFVISKDTINVNSVSLAKIFDTEIGYIKIDKFTSTSYNEFRSAFYNLMKQKQLTGLIIDLRGNGGGILQEAVKICNMFIPQNSPILSTNGRFFSKNYLATSQPIDTNIPLIVLIDERSASASEIIAGCFQDLDRALIVGNYSFGKGLVQEIFDLSHSKILKLTTAKYYTPSGRCIQKINYASNNLIKLNNIKSNILKPSINVNRKSVIRPDIEDKDSLNFFYTKNGRKVYELNGIMPDLISTPDTLKNLLSKSLNENFIVFNFANFYSNSNDLNKYNYQMSDTIYQQFINYVSDSKNIAAFENIALLDEMKKNEVSQTSANIINDAINLLLAEYRNILLNDNECRAELEKELDNVIKYKILSEKEYYEYILSNDKVLNTALMVFKNGKYNELLATVPDL